MMKLIQKILSHGLLIAFIAAAFFAYTNRAKLFPDWFGKAETAQRQSGAEKIAATKANPEDRKVSRPRPEKVISKKPVAPREDAGQEKAVEPVPGGASGSKMHEPEKAGTPDEKPAVSPQSQTDSRTSAPVVEQAATPAAGSAVETAPPAVEAAAAAAAVTSQLADTPPTAPPATPVSPVEPQAVTAADATADADEAAGSTAVAALQPSAAIPPAQASPPGDIDIELEKQLKAARQLYWRRDMRAAANAYKALTERYPQNPDVWGELGNFHFSLRQREPAGAAYARCVGLLIDQGESVRAQQLLNVLYRLDALKARELENRLQQAGG